MNQRFPFLVSVLLLGVLLLPPVLWGCEEAETSDCSMQECPFAGPRVANGCHEAAESSQDPSMTDGRPVPGTQFGCCVTSMDPDTGKATSGTVRELNPTSLTVSIESVAPRQPRLPSDLMAQTVAAQVHDLGRFTLLSSFLL